MAAAASWLRDRRRDAARATATRVYACEVETAAPLPRTLAAGRAVSVEHTPSFVDGIGGRSVLAEMWPLTSTLLAGSLVASLSRSRQPFVCLCRVRRVVAEGAGAAPVSRGTRACSRPSSRPAGGVFRGSCQAGISISRILTEILSGKI